MKGLDSVQVSSASVLKFVMCSLPHSLKVCKVAQVNVCTEYWEANRVDL